MTLRFTGKKVLEWGVSWDVIDETEYFYVILADFPNNKETHMPSSIIILKIHELNWPVMEVVWKNVIL